MVSRDEGTGPGRNGDDPELFLSYSRRDRERALPIIRIIEDAGYKVWWDGRLEAGETYLEKTEQALEAAPAVVVLWSKHSVTSDWVRDEAMRGRERGCLVPLSIDGSMPPLGFRQYQVIDLSNWTGKGNDPAILAMLLAISRNMGQTGRSFSGLPDQHHGLVRRHLLVGGAIAGGTAIVGATAWSWLGRGATANGNSVAVLPFSNINEDPDLNYLSNGLSSEVRSTLARNSALRVIGGNSSAAVVRRGLDAIQAARELKVRFIVEGSIQIIDGIATFYAALIDGRSGFQKWAERYRHDVEDILSLRELIADEITAQLSAAFTAQKAPLELGGARSPSAFNDYLKGVELYRSAIDTQTDIAALARFDAAISADPGFADAHAARAQTLTVLGNTSDSVQSARAYYDEAEAAARTAIRQGPDLAEAHSTLGFVLFQAKLQILQAREPFGKSVALGPGEAAVLARYSNYCAATLKIDEALRHGAMAVTLDPLNPTIHRGLGFAHYAARDFRKSMQHVETALKLNPNLSDSHARLANALYHLGKPREAVEQAGKEPSRLMRYPALAIALAATGEMSAAETAFNDLVATYGDAGLYQQAQVLAQWGQTDRALDTLNRALELGDSGLTYLDMDPALDPLRSMADFRQLRSRLGFDRV